MNTLEDINKKAEQLVIEVTNCLAVIDGQGGTQPDCWQKLWIAKNRLATALGISFEDNIPAPEYTPNPIPVPGALPLTDSEIAIIAKWVDDKIPNRYKDATGKRIKEMVGAVTYLRWAKYGGNPNAPTLTSISGTFAAPVPKWSIVSAPPEPTPSKPPGKTISLMVDSDGDEMTAGAEEITSTVPHGLFALLSDFIVKERPSLAVGEDREIARRLISVASYLDKGGYPSREAIRSYLRMNYVMAPEQLQHIITLSVKTGMLKKSADTYTLVRGAPNAMNKLMEFAQGTEAPSSALVPHFES